MRWRGRATQRNWWFMLYLALETTLQRAWLTSPICCMSSLKPSALAVPWLLCWGPGTLLVGQHVTAELSPPAPCPEWDLPQQTLLLLYPQPASSYSRSVKTPFCICKFLLWTPALVMGISRASFMLHSALWSFSSSWCGFAFFFKRSNPWRVRSQDPQTIVFSNTKPTLCSYKIQQSFRQGDLHSEIPWQ